MNLNPGLDKKSIILTSRSFCSDLVLKDLNLSIFSTKSKKKNSEYEKTGTSELNKFKKQDKIYFPNNDTYEYELF